MSRCSSWVPGSVAGLAACLVLGAAASALAQDARTAGAADLPPSLAPATRQAIVRLADSVVADRLPAAPLYAKSAEGVLKGADDGRILAAERTLARELGEARGALAPASDAEIVAGASALHVGATVEDLRGLRRVAGDRSGTDSLGLATPLVVLADFLTRRVSPAVAAAAVDSLVARRAPGPGYAALRAAVVRDIDAGRSPEAATLARTRALLRALEVPHGASR